MKTFQSREAGYQRIQGTKPQTLAYALQVHCAGIGAHILRVGLHTSDLPCTNPDRDQLVGPNTQVPVAGPAKCPVLRLPSC